MAEQSLLNISAFQKVTTNLGKLIFVKHARKGIPGVKCYNLVK